MLGLDPARERAVRDAELALDGLLTLEVEGVERGQLDLELVLLPRLGHLGVGDRNTPLLGLARRRLILALAFALGERVVVYVYVGNGSAQWARAELEHIGGKRARPKLERIGGTRAWAKVERIGGKRARAEQEPRYSGSRNLRRISTAL